MKIAVDARELRTSSGRYVERLLEYLQDIDTENDYVIILTQKDFDGWAPKNPKFTKVVTVYKEFTFGEQIGFCRQITNIGADIVHFPMVQQPIMYRGTVVTTLQDLTTCRFRNPTKNPIVFTTKQQIYKWLNKRVAKKSKLLITPTEFVKQDIVDFTGVSADKITVTLESADPITEPATPLPLATLQTSNFIMYVGRPTPHKNLWRLIEAFSVLRNTHPSLQLVLAGKKDKMYEMVEAQAREKDLLKGVIFAGFVKEGELRWLYENCAAYIFPSLSEGFGLPGLEAMLHGAPVVSSNSTCLPEVHGDAAHYFDPLDVNDIAGKIADVLDDTQLRETLITKGRQQVAKFSWKRMAAQTLGVYEQALLKK